MKSVGKQLQEARLARNWTPELAARETKIKVDRVRDLEADDYTHFSSPTYARGFVRTYARALGLDEYKILRQLDTRLPEDETSSFGADTGIPYVPEPSSAGVTGAGINPGLYVVFSLGLGVFLVIAFILFEAYRAGVLQGYFTESSPTEQLAASTTNESETAPARAKPVDPNAAPPPITADSNAVPQALPVESTPPTVAPTDANAPFQAVRALPVDLNALNASPATTDTNAPIQAVRALPVDPSELTNAASLMAVESPSAPPSDDNGTNAPIQAVRALPVEPGEPAAASPATTAMPAAGATNAAPNDSSARLSNAGPVHLPPGALPAAPPAGDPMTAAANDSPQAVAMTDNAAAKRLVLTASRDSFVRVTSEDVAGTEKVLYAGVIHTGQSVGFDGRKFSINVALPAAVDITLDGVNYGPHSNGEAPETFTVESRLP